MGKLPLLQSFFDNFNNFFLVLFLCCIIFWTGNPSSTRCGSESHFKNKAFSEVHPKVHNLDVYLKDSFFDGLAQSYYSKEAKKCQGQAVKGKNYALKSFSGRSIYTSF
jgi:hypothetical protein